HSITIYSQEHKRFQKAVGTKGITLPLSSSHLFLRLPYGFARYQIEADTVDYFSFNSGFRERLYAIYEDFQGRLWIGMFDGLFQFAGDSLLRPQPFFPKMGLRVERIAQLADSTLVIGTKGGGVLLWKDEHYLEITKADGLTSDMVETLHIDSAQHIWVGTLQGLNKITLYPEVNVKTFTTRNGLPSNEINEVDSYGDQVWAATRGGLLKLPAERKTTAASPAPLLEEVRVNGQERPAAAIDVLPFRENDLRFTFLSINYFLDGHIPYRYRLSADEPWVNTQNRQVDFAALAPGQYRFEVQAQNEDGIWSDSTVLPFRILPPFWAAWWFWAIIGAMAAGIGYLFY
ncbi:MAG: hypothetical protein KDD06_16035, partial [Phaeodactylibacter sp.]|nr:hypothetical protein [Phaeodactylibacter sp.]